MTQAQRDSYDNALGWLKAAKHITVIGHAPERGDPVHVTLIVSGAPKVTA